MSSRYTPRTPICHNRQHIRSGGWLPCLGWGNGVLAQQRQPEQRVGATGWRFHRQYLVLGVDRASRVVSWSDGTPTPACKLDIAGDVNATGVLTVNAAGISSFPNGSVGIGTASPQAGLHVRNGRIRIEDSSTPTLDLAVGTMVCGDIWSTGGSLCMQPNAPNAGVSLYFRNGGQPGNGIILDSAGNVGIGTPSPAHRLEVAGDVGVTGNINLAGGYQLIGNAQAAAVDSIQLVASWRL